MIKPPDSLAGGPGLADVSQGSGPSGFRFFSLGRHLFRIPQIIVLLGPDGIDRTGPHGFEGALSAYGPKINMTE